MACRSPNWTATCHGGVHQVVPKLLHALPGGDLPVGRDAEPPVARALVSNHRCSQGERMRPLALLGCLLMKAPSPAASLPVRR